MKLGIDYGSTYTIASTYDENSKNLEAFILGGMTSPCIPTVVASKNSQVEYGVVAKKLTGKKGYEVFRGFKMLLAEENEERLVSRGFTNELSPSKCTELFLDNLLKMISDNNDEMVTDLVVGVPEVWFQEMNSISGRGILRDICRSLPNVKSDGVKMVSEPACASAFFAYNYMNIMNTPFEGHILLIDYGGGTLDINLTKISAEKSTSEKQYMEIKVLESTGAGENLEGKLGQAGILYMETVMEQALIEAGIWEADSSNEKNGKFYKLVNELEDFIIAGKVNISNTFQALKGEDLDELEEIEFVELEYRDDDYVSVTYATLKKAYDEAIRGVFQEKLDEMKEFLQKYNIDIHDDQHFKIALVGGFGSYYLVREQVERTFKVGSAGMAMKNILQKEEDRERAISYGAALFAADIVGMRQTAPYSITLFLMNPESKPELYYTLKYKEDIEYDTPYYMKDKDGTKVPCFLANSSVKEFVINLGHHDRTAFRVPLKIEFQKRLSNIVKNKYKTAIIGFSLDSSEILRMHVQEYDPGHPNAEGTETIIELAKFNELFEMTKVTPVYK